ncbi:M15 family peptidase [Listeria grandensis]|uniref:M15 family metallopeptidase n=1 Tax=Listeria grandensis TaxID=1494963 RepID=UPI00162645A4|nr:M15 family metallopeptidase [Listeria grandensis]MBC1474895.1 M15 family peptidase [Listeria grandensis]
MGKLHYSDRSWGNIAKLANDTKAKATALFKYAEDNNIEVLIYETIRTKAQQEANVKSGASQTMKSYHLVGQALDFVPTKGASTIWDGYERADIKKFIAKAKSLGFEWGGDWKGFVDKPHLQNNYKGYGTDTFGNTVSKPQPTPSKPIAGGSIVDYLNSKKIDSSMANRKKLAAKYGIANYTGTAAQNTALLNKLKAGAVPSKPVQSGYKGTSLVDYLKSVKKASDYSSRSKYATQYGIKDYKGSTSQNLQLLKKMRGF